MRGGWDVRLGSTRKSTRPTPPILPICCSSCPSHPLLVRMTSKPRLDASIVRRVPPSRAVPPSPRKQHVRFPCSSRGAGSPLQHLQAALKPRETSPARSNGCMGALVCPRREGCGWVGRAGCASRRRTRGEGAAALPAVKPGKGRGVVKSESCRRRFGARTSCQARTCGRLRFVIGQCAPGRSPT